MRKNDILRILVDVIYYIAGSMLYSVAIICIIVPNQLTPGGLSGISAVLNYFFRVPIGMTTLILNIPLLIAGWCKFGKKFVARTAVATFISSILLDLTAAFIPVFELEGILAAIFGGILLGAGLGIVFLRGATTGGTDIAAKLINARFRHISMGRCVLILDMLVVTLSTLVYGNIESGLYSVVALYVSSRAMDGFLYGNDSGKLIFAVSRRSREISDMIMSELGRGVTMLPAVGAYTGSEHKMLLCAVRRPEVARIHRIIQTVDKNAFIIVCDAGEIVGEGFKMP